jgi:antitoxin component YwqK of YwqJK toxin-antitoxin module
MMLETRSQALSVAALLLLTSTGGPARAQQGPDATPPPPGIDLKLVPSFTKLVKASGPIFTAQVLRIATRRNQLLGHGRRHPFVESVRLQVRILAPLRGEADLQRLRHESPKPWLIIPNGNPPGLRAKPDHRLAWQFDLARKLKRGDRVVVYLQRGQSATLEKRVSYFHLRHLNRVAILPTLQRALTLALQDKLTKLRSGASCKKPQTWRLEGGCHATAALARKIQCPDGTTATSKQEKGFLSFWCVTSSGQAQGPYLKWLPSGDLGWRGSKARGQLHGEMVHYLKSGKPGKRMAYHNGKLHGRWIAYHPSGKVRDERQMVNGLRDGACKQYDKAGKLLGSYTLRRGSGVAIEWHENGQKQREMHHHRGKLHGAYKVWTSDGAISIVGQHRNGQSHGKWYNYNGGKLEIITCYRRDREIWDTSEIKRGKRRACR